MTAPTALIIGSVDITALGPTAGCAPIDTPRPFPKNVDPKHGLPATWRGTTCVDAATGTQIGFSLDTEQGVVRFVLNLRCARDLADSLGDYMRLYEARGGKTSHSPSSSGSPSAPGSAPDEGQKV